MGSQKIKVALAPISLRVKAFIIDIFLIAMPILYITTYLVLDGKDDFRSNQTAIFVCNVLYAIIICIFFAIKAQSPGYKSQNIYLINIRTGKRLSFIHVAIRFLCFVLAGFSFFGLLMVFFRTDKLALHDLMSHSAAVYKKN